jgi:type I restriction enzyme S subunit
MMTESCATVPLGSVTTWLSGGTPDRSRDGYWGGPIPWISAATLKAFAVEKSDQGITLDAVRAGSPMAPVGSTLILVRGMSVHREVRAGVVIQPVAFNQDVKALVPTRSLYPRFLTYSLLARSSQILRLVTSAGSGTGVLETGPLKRLRIWLPALSEQTRLVKILDHVEGHVAALERLIAKKEAVRQGMMQRLLTGKTRLSGFNGVWVHRPIGVIAHVTMGQSPPSLSYNFDRRGLPLVQGNADIRDRRTIDRLWTAMPMKRCAAGDVLLTVRAPVGSAAIASSASCLGRGVCALRAYGNSRYLFHALVRAESRWATVGQGSTFTAVDSSQVLAFPIALPDDPAEEAAIAAVLDEVEISISLLRARLTKAKSIKQGMMQELLTGRTRFPVAEEKENP